MKGLELAKKYYEAYGKEMLEKEFPDVLPYLAVGLVGSGSECLGFDDDISTDHDYEIGFCIFLPGEEIVDRKAAFALERAYAKLPQKFEGVSRSRIDPVGGSRHGVIRTEEFYKEKTGLEAFPPTTEDWFRIPSYALREATDGEVFRDPYGEFSRIRESLMQMPEEVRRKKLAGHLLMMAQAGQYNYPRIVARGEEAAAQMAIFEFVKHTQEAVFLLNRQYLPYYKWGFRAMRDLPLLADLEFPLYTLMSTDNEAEMARGKAEMIEEVSVQVIDELHRQELTEATCHNLEKHAYSVNDGIGDNDVRTRHILYAV